MMNIFTRFLARNQGDDDVTAFIAQWDALEALVIRVYRARSCTAAERRAYESVAGQLREAYPRWAARLRPYWQSALVDGRRAEADPFAGLLAPDTADAFVGNWPAMQQLPAAREAINRWLVDNNR